MHKTSMEVTSKYLLSTYTFSPRHTRRTTDITFCRFYVLYLKWISGLLVSIKPAIEQPKWILFVVNQCAIPILIELHSQYRIDMNYLCMYSISYSWLDWYWCVECIATDWISERWRMLVGMIQNRKRYSRFTNILSASICCRNAWHSMESWGKYVFGKRIGNLLWWASAQLDHNPYKQALISNSTHFYLNYAVWESPVLWRCKNAVRIHQSGFF